MSTEENKANNLEDVFLNAWKEAHGFCRAEVSIMSKEGQLTAVINGAFSQAEQELARKEAGKNLLQRYETELLNQVLDRLVKEVENRTGKNILSYTPSMNISANQILFHFQFHSK